MPFIACLFPEHRNDPYNKGNNYNNRQDAHDSARFKYPANYGTTAKAQQQQHDGWKIYLFHNWFI
jgi:hypothetical protein